MVLYEMIELTPPFKAESMSELYKNVLGGCFPPISSDYSKDLAKTVGSLL